MAQILIAEDDSLIAKMAYDTLAAEGHACSWVASGEEALELLRRHQPDLLVLDHDMPGLTGQQVLRELRGSALNHDLPVIMLTAAPSEENATVAHFIGAQAYVRKPLDARVLRYHVERVLQQRSGRPAHHPARESRSYTPGRHYETQALVRRFV
jgi:DNA-binding response OmpR family regulator